MLRSILADIFSILGLIFTISMTKRHAFEKSHTNRRYITLATILIAILTLEIATILMTDSDNNTFVIINRFANTLGFALSPLFTYFLLVFSLYNETFLLSKKLLSIPLYCNALLCVLSNKTGWIFFVDSHNQYTRGILFLVPTGICFFYYFLMIIFSVKNRKDYDYGDLAALFIIILMPIAATICQIIYKDLILIWNCAAICLLLYYVFLRELQFTRDIQTDVKNRAAFEKEMLQCIRHNKSAVIISFDVNNLKQTNDKYGHKAGDELLFEAAQAIKKCFDNLGNTYRVGGDEFCVVCEEVPTQLAEYALNNLDHLLITINQTRYNKLVIAYGFAFYDKDGDESIYTVFSKADRAMYNHKANLKKIKDSTPEI